MEGVALGPSVGGRIDERVDHPGELQHRTGPAVGDDHRQGIVMDRADVLEVDVEPVDGGDEVGPGIDGGLASAPVVFAGPVLAHLPQIGKRNALRPVVDDLGLGPAGAGQPVAQVVDLGVVDRDGEGADVTAHGSIVGSRPAAEAARGCMGVPAPAERLSCRSRSLRTT